MKVGLANIITLTTFIILGFRAALMVTLLRVTLASIFSGSFLGPGFVLAMGGGLAGIIAMSFCSFFIPGLFGPVGLSLVGALFHNLSQLSLAYLLFVQKIEPILIIAPFLILIGTVTGTTNGLVADSLVQNLKTSTDPVQNTRP